MILDDRLTKYIDSVSWDIPEYLQEIEKRALSEGVPIIRKSTQSLLKFMIKTKKPVSVLEVGTAVGFSALLMSEYLLDGAVIDTIEKVPVRINAAKENFKKYASDGKITLYEGDADSVLKQLCKIGKKYDMVFVDAAKGQYLNYLLPVLKMLNDEGYLITDNVLQDGDIVQSRYAVTRRDRTIHGRMRKYLYTLTHTKGLDTVILPVGDGVSITVKQKHYSESGEDLC